MNTPEENAIEARRAVKRAHRLVKNCEGLGYEHPSRYDVYCAREEARWEWGGPHYQRDLEEGVALSRAVPFKKARLAWLLVEGEPQLIEIHGWHHMPEDPMYFLELEQISGWFRVEGGHAIHCRFWFEGAQRDVELLHREGDVYALWRSF